MDSEFPTREVRLGLVMYGGVSLAVYINGVSNELFRVVRGRGVYGLIKHLSHSDVVVDVLSGSSAGGINGIFLAYALCNEVEFDTSARLWREHGDIDRLLRPIDGPADSFRSLLDSEQFYQPRLEEAFRAMDIHPISGSSTASQQPERPSRVRELDLFVTGTDFHGRVSESVDERGQLIRIKDHRVLFWLKHRAGRKCPFSPKGVGDDALFGTTRSEPHTHQALAKLARITSCFPGAFRPVTVSDAKEGVDARLRRWGRITESEPRVLIDGGVLDNKPFTSTLHAIYHRTADRKVSRHLLFVEPDPERFQAGAAPITEPTILDTVLASLLRLPSYESIADDLRSLEAHNEQVYRLEMVASTATRDSDAQMALERATLQAVYRKARLMGLFDGVLASLFQNAEGDPIRRIDRHALRRWFQEHLLENEAAGLGVLERYDIEFRLRRLFHLTYFEHGRALPPRALLRFLNSQIQVLEIVRAAMQSAVEQLAFDGPEPDRVWAKTQEALDRILSVTFAAYETPLPRLSDAEEMLGDAAREALGRALREGGVALASGRASLLVRSDSFERLALAAYAEAAPEELDRLVLREYDHFQARDRLAYPLELVSGIHERDLIKTTRISPVDAQLGFSKRALEQKVTGIQLAHFGAFFKRSWRSNDILWGRLDAAAQLVGVLLDEQRLVELARLDPTRFRVSGLEKLVPKLSPERLERLRELFESIAGAPLGTAGDRAKRVLPEIQGLLIEAEQLQILETEMPNVIGDAAAEQLAWNHFKEQGTGGPGQGKVGDPTELRVAIDPASLSFRAGKGRFDPAVLTFASVQLAREALDGQKQSIAKLFPHYRVGEETLDNIPRVVLLDLLARALVVLRNCLIHVLGERGDSIRASAIYKLFLDYPLRALATLAGALRRAPGLLGGFIIASVLYALVSVLAVVKLGVLDASHAANTWGVALFLIAPILLLALALLLGGTHARRAGSSWFLSALGISVKLSLVALVALVLAGFWRWPEAELCGTIQHMLQESGVFGVLGDLDARPLEWSCGPGGTLKIVWFGKLLTVVAVLFTGLSVALPQAPRRWLRSLRAWS